MELSFNHDQITDDEQIEMFRIGHTYCCIPCYGVYQKQNRLKFNLKSRFAQQYDPQQK